jgi:hypothetical protein
MEFMLNGQLITCTPDEYARLIQLGLIPTQSAETKAAPIQITPKPSLPDDIVPLPKEDFPQYPKVGDTPDWLRNGTNVVALYGCVVDQHTQIGDPYMIKAYPKDTVHIEVTNPGDIIGTITPKITAIADVQTDDRTKYYVLKKKGADEWWSTKGDEFTTTDEKYARLFTDPEEARRIIDFTGSRFGELEIVPYIKK